MPNTHYTYYAMPMDVEFPMKKLIRSDLLSLEKYAEARSQFRGEVLQHKRHRKIALGRHITLLFEDRLTIQYQVQEMLRAERIFEPNGIEEELAAYNPLIPDGSNLKATMLIEYEDAEARQIALVRLRGIEHQVFIRIGGDRTDALADEDLARSDEAKTSAVHFLRFELTKEAQKKALNGATISFGIDHQECAVETEPPALVKTSLLQDLSG